LVFDKSKLKVKQQFDNECTVMIWRTSKAWLGLGGLKHPGHTSVLLRKTRNEEPTFDDMKSRYVSFWPGGNWDKRTKAGEYISLRNGNFLGHPNFDYRQELGARARGMLDDGLPARLGQILVSTGTSDSDEFPDYGQLPDVVISLQAMAPNQITSLGLQINRIVDWCKKFFNSPDFNYKYISSTNNCSGVAVRALSAGGADAFAVVGGCSRKSSIYFTPNDAEDWANSVAVGIQRVNEWLQSLNNEKSSASPWRYLPTVDEWKTASHKSLSFRGSETRGVDEALAVWHENSKGWDEPDKFTKGFGALVSVIQHTHMHMLKDPNSARNGAYKDLARSILSVVKLLAQKAADDWDISSYYGSHRKRPWGSEVPDDNT